MSNFAYLSRAINKSRIKFDMEPYKDSFLMTFDGSIVAIERSLTTPYMDRVLQNKLGYSKEDNVVKLDSIENMTLVCSYLAYEEDIASSEYEDDSDWDSDS